MHVRNVLQVSMQMQLGQILVLIVLLVRGRWKELLPVTIVLKVSIVAPWILVAV